MTSNKPVPVPEVLEKWGLKVGATEAEIKRKYYALVRIFHPDRLGAEGESIMTIVNGEIDILKAAGLVK